MTLIGVAKCKDGIVIASDMREIRGGEGEYNDHTEKIIQIEPNLAFAVSGDYAFFDSMRLLYPYLFKPTGTEKMTPEKFTEYLKKFRLCAFELHKPMANQEDCRIVCFIFAYCIEENGKMVYEIVRMIPPFFTPTKEVEDITFQGVKRDAVIERYQKKYGKHNSNIPSSKIKSRIKKIIQSFISESVYLGGEVDIVTITPTFQRLKKEDK